MNRIRILLATLCLTIFATGCLTIFATGTTAAAEMAPDQPRHWRLIWTKAPQKRAVVAWDTAIEGKEHRVYYDLQGRGGKLEHYEHEQLCNTTGAYGKDLYYHYAELTDLSPGTTYYFVMASDDAVSEEFHFITAPAQDVPFKIIFGGDSRSGIADRRKMNQRIATLAATDKSILAFAHGGDYVSNGRKLDQWKGWMSDHELTVTEHKRMLPLIPARGNHERSGPLYNQVMAFPGGKEKNYFATELSPEVLFLTLNTETKADGAQKEFLESNLKSAQDLRWRVVQYHRPVYPAVKKPGAGRKHWVPLFEKYNVALGCEADGHCIKRTVPIRNDKADPTGVVYIGEGGLGVHQRKPKTDRWFLQEPGMAGQGHHVQLLSFTKSQLTITVIGMDGEELDKHHINTRRTK